MNRRPDHGGPHGVSATEAMEWHAGRHSAVLTDDYLFSQLIPYIGNKRKLLGLIAQAIAATGEDPATTDFVDLFAGTGVVSRLAKSLGFRVLSNDWEPYSEVLNHCHVVMQAAPWFHGGRSYAQVIAELNALPPLEGWVTRHLCPDDDVHYDITRDRMFYMRRNGMRIDAIRERIAQWEHDGLLSAGQKACLLAPLLYSASYNSNTSGLFKGFHRGWGGRTGTALYRIAATLCLRPACFIDNGRDNHVLRMDAQDLAAALAGQVGGNAIAYVDPPYNQHPYGANYHVLNTIALWDQPRLAPKITGRDKAAIRQDWRSARRSAYNHRGQALAAYRRLLSVLDTRWVATSYSTDGFIPLPDMVRANCERGQVQVFTRGYKRYRVSRQRYSARPMTVEFILLTHTRMPGTRSPDEIVDEIRTIEASLNAGTGT
ncbi:Modification methylase NlaIII [Gluconacetobacter sp. SXCC-1]|uniref:DNA methyltransferase n=1 Tax=Komagataeibacter rhaeticus TaxID=215221 RepID=A0A181CCF0_9PROT|nr:DNA adenine methylase [Komagataeibacter rhaeticus]ATU71948.1 DNA methyltransferase [Komagataeibacter xylinus]EGG75669.1 Modification methylase NlaIII [Gluconacetobacter sp. SXCC-1]QIP35930.1 DNA methyltransferase [Komagataeibacter rhaeticus]QOC45691.1 DNA adenine methylase [Komagataeibacter rhaeticus]WPP21642.1 DNA adenine methylase [Komagataeibacter rhaeticus]